ncbi:DUF4083 family protein [Paenibacillus castaneae]|uniref:DUF4083 family protein n=1 Tax=Paenibacillus castaneae TaxID=474957 RepID=UPI001FBB6179|nr:DUF4083 family protein [Paenibacillus castaneae]
MLIVVLGLIILFVISFTLFIKKLLNNSSQKGSSYVDLENRLERIENKLDFILEKIKST